MLSCLLLTATAFGQGPGKLPAKVEKDVLAATIRVNGRTGGCGVVIVPHDDKSINVYALTAAHLVEDSKEALVFPFSEPPGKEPLKAYVIDRRPIAGEDIALLRIEDPDGRLTGALPIAKRIREAPFSAFSVGLVPKEQTVRAEKTIGAPEVNKGGAKAKFWECAAEPEEGRSGGPLVDDSGRLLGICSGSHEKKGYYTHLEAIHKIVNSSDIGVSFK